MWSSLDGLAWLFLTLALLVFLQRMLHREIQAVLLIVTRSPVITTNLFAFLFLPGVFLHELSHYLMAKLLRIRTGRFSLIPRSMPDGRLQLGYVETYRADVFRDSLVGAAPVIFGLAAVAWISVEQLRLLVLWDTLRNGQWGLFFLGLQTLPAQPFFWIWLYLTFVISSTMLPSASDRHAWAPVILVGGTLLGLALLAGMGPWMLEHLAPFINQFLRGTALILLVSVLVHLVFIFPMLFLHRLVTRMTGLDVA